MIYLQTRREQIQARDVLSCSIVARDAHKPTHSSTQNGLRAHPHDGERPFLSRCMQIRKIDVAGGLPKYWWRGNTAMFDVQKQATPSHKHLR